MEHVREQLTDDELVDLVLSGKISSHRLEALTGNPDRAVLLRRRILTLQLSRIAHINGPLLEHIPHSNYPFEKVMGQCCENVIGYLTMPLGVVGPLMVDGLSYWVPMATTEGALIASVQRGSKALLLSGGVSTIMYGDGMTRGPVIQFPSIQDVCSFKSWVDNPLHFDDLVKVFNNTSRYTKLLSLDVAPAGVDVFLRFKASTGDAMGMNMVSKGTERTLSYLSTLFPRMRVISLSGNYCTDKKAASLNWIDGRGKSIIAEAVLSAETVQTILKVTPEQLVKTHLKKNFKGSAMAGSLGGGGFNAQASNVVTAIFLATGQDPAQNIVSSNCLTELEIIDQAEVLERIQSENDFLNLDEKASPQGYLRITCTMPSIEVGTVGGGTNLPCQKACLSMMGLEGATREKEVSDSLTASTSSLNALASSTASLSTTSSISGIDRCMLTSTIAAGGNAQTLARIICATVMAGELSLLAALTEGSLVRSHLSLNRRT